MDANEGTVEVAFVASDRFLNPTGVVQGGFLAAMLDDTLEPALTATVAPNQFAPTADLHVQFLAPARPGRLIGHGGSSGAARALPSSPANWSTTVARWWRSRQRRRPADPGSSGMRAEAELARATESLRPALEVARDVDAPDWLICAGAPRPPEPHLPAQPNPCAAVGLRRAHRFQRLGPALAAPALLLTSTVARIRAWPSMAGLERRRDLTSERRAC